MKGIGGLKTPYRNIERTLVVIALFSILQVFKKLFNYSMKIQSLWYTTNGCTGLYNSFVTEHRNELSVPVDKGPTRYQCAVHVVKEIERTIQAKQLLSEGRYRAFGGLMNESHVSLRLVGVVTVCECLWSLCVSGCGHCM